MGTAALVVGVVALVLVVLILFAPLGALLGLVALVLGIVGLVRANRGQADNRGQALAGLVTGALALVVGLFFAASIGAFFATNVNDFPAVRQLLGRRPRRPGPRGLRRAARTQSGSVATRQSPSGPRWGRGRAGPHGQPRSLADSQTRGRPCCPQVARPVKAHL